MYMYIAKMIIGSYAVPKVNPDIFTGLYYIYYIIFIQIQGWTKGKNKYLNQYIMKINCGMMIVVSIIFD